MLIRICLIVAILAGIAAGALDFTVVKTKINTLTTDRNTQRDGRIAAETERDKTKKTLAKTQTDLKQTQQQLADSQTAEKKAQDVAAAQTKRADDLSDKLAKATQDRDAAQNALAAYTVSGLTAEQVATLGKSLKKAQDTIIAINEEKAVLQRTIDRLKTRIAYYEGTNPIVTLPPNLHGKIVVVDPKWDFVVLNIGDDQGLRLNGELLVSRDGRLVAKVIVRTVEKDRSIANVVPGWKLGEVIEGDEVSPAHPAS
jgi:Skp family chaperone for outer membrane proteins